MVVICKKLQPGMDLIGVLLGNIFLKKPDKFVNNFIQQYRNLDRTIRDEYERLGLRCLSEVKFNDEHPLSFFSHSLDKVKNINTFHFYKYFSEISFVSLRFVWFKLSVSFFPGSSKKPLNETGDSGRN